MTDYICLSLGCASLFLVLAIMREMHKTEKIAKSNSKMIAELAELAGRDKKCQSCKGTGLADPGDYKFENTQRWPL